MQNGEVSNKGALRKLGNQGMPIGLIALPAANDHNDLNEQKAGCPESATATGPVLHFLTLNSFFLRS